MKELIYQVEFLSDIVLPSSSNTEGNISQLDFIPGSNFLGMVAKYYNNFEDSFKVFHSGKVKFGDATVLQDGKQTYKMPLSYFHKKLDDKNIYNHHFIKDSEFKELGQLKQKRSGYITKDKKIVNIDYNYSQKSAYDKDKRRSKDSSMYGYSAIQSGTKCQFSIKIDDTISSNDIELIKSSIIGKKRLGKSKSAQYGLVDISFKGTSENIEDKNSNELILYANSRLALVDECGNPSYDLKYLFDGLSDENIDYSKCQIKTSTFTPYNTSRETKDYERVCINKGSVIVLKDIKIENIQNLVGAYQSEGFGEILINPEFLNDKDSFNLVSDAKDEKKSNNQREKITQTFEETTVQFLVNRHNQNIDKLNLANEVADFIDKNSEKYNKKMNSQWGTIRSICSNSNDVDIRNDVEKYISNGIAKTKWDGGKKSTLLDAIKESETPLEFTKLLSMQMPKVKDMKKGKEQKND